MYNTYFYNQMLNQTYINPTFYFQNQARIQQYQFEQSHEVVKAVNAVRDMCEAVKRMDARHQEQAFYLCLAEIANHFGWN